MTEQNDLLTAKEFAALMNMSTSTLTKKLRSGEIKGEKISGKWMIAKSELNGETQPARKETITEEATPKATRAAGPAYSVDEFAEKTYLTQAGVIAFLKKGKLKGSQGSDGQWIVDSDSLALPHIRHLVR